jgi:hypothetical protein
MQKDVDALLAAPMGFLSGLEAQAEITELLDELYGVNPMPSRTTLGGGPQEPDLWKGPSGCRKYFTTLRAG